MTILISVGETFVFYTISQEYFRFIFFFYQRATIYYKMIPCEYPCLYIRYSHFCLIYWVDFKGIRYTFDPHWYFDENMHTIYFSPSQSCQFKYVIKIIQSCATKTWSRNFRHLPKILGYFYISILWTDKPHFFVSKDKHAFFNFFLAVWNHEK